MIRKIQTRFYLNRNFNGRCCYARTQLYVLGRDNRRPCEYPKTWPIGKASGGNAKRRWTAPRKPFVFYNLTFLAQPAAFAHWMIPMCQNYIRLAEAVHTEPDIELLQPIVAVFQQQETANPHE